jgi:hypothetical protein
MKLSSFACRIAWSLTAILGLANLSQAGYVALTLSGSPSVDTNGPWTLGFEFKANAATSVEKLGFYDDNGDGLTESHFVGIWDLSGNLLTSATVSPTDPLVDSFRYTSISPLKLTAGTNYVIGAMTGWEKYSWGWSVTTPAEITFVTDRFDLNYNGTGIVDFPESSAGRTATGAGWLGPNFIIVPEPGSFVLLGMGAAVLIGCRRSRKTRA